MNTTPLARANRVVEVMATTTLLLALGVIVGLVGLYLYFARDLPKISAISDYRPPSVSEVFDTHGIKIGEFWEECRLLMPLEEIPPQVVNAFIASEDERFWEHPGVDWKSIVRAFFKNLRAGRIVEGGSTITQQITRSLLLTPERSLKRKIKEAILATKIEKNLNKKQILFLYLNQIYLGNRAYGIKAAARNYFHKEVGELFLAEIALIAGMPSAPSYYSPFTNPADALERRNYVLERMVTNGFISKREADQAATTPLILYRAGTDKDGNIALAPHFVEHVRRAIQQKYGDEPLYKGGLKIFTTLDLELNRAATLALRQGLWELALRQGYKGPLSKLKTENEIRKFGETVHKEVSGFDLPIPFPPSEDTNPSPTPLKPDRLIQGVLLEAARPGEPVKVLVGNRRGVIPSKNRPWQSLAKGSIVWVRLLEPPQEGDPSFAIQEYPKVEGALLSFEPLTGKIRAMVGGYDARTSEFNRAVQAYRQPGSSFKPIVYAAALDKGFTPSTIIDDSPVVFHQFGSEPWMPKNYGNKYYGPLPVRTALARSLNVVTAKIMYRIRPHYAVAYARKLGIESPMYKYLSMALGAADLTLQELTTAYGVFATGGVRPRLNFITRIVDAQGNVLEENQLEEIVYPPPHAIASDKTTDYNPFLLEEGEGVIARESIHLKEYEKKILYGRQIPDGYAITPQTAYLMTDLLQEVVNSGTGVRARALERPAAGKTGTTNEETDTWFVGYTPQLLAGVWIGYDSKRHLGKGETGGHTALPVWLRFMKKALEGKPIASFQPPADLKVADINTLKGGSAIAAGHLIQWEPEAGTTETKTSQEKALDFLSRDL